MLSGMWALEHVGDGPLEQRELITNKEKQQSLVSLIQSDS